MSLHRVSLVLACLWIAGAAGAQTGYPQLDMTLSPHVTHADVGEWVTISLHVIHPLGGDLEGRKVYWGSSYGKYHESWLNAAGESYWTFTSTEPGQEWVGAHILGFFDLYGDAEPVVVRWEAVPEPAGWACLSALLPLGWLMKRRGHIPKRRRLTQRPGQH